MSCGLVGTMSCATGSCSPGFGASPGRLFFFSLDVGGWRRDCEKPGIIMPITSNTERDKAKNAYIRLDFIVLTPEGQPTIWGCDALAMTGVYHYRPIASASMTMS